MPSAAEARDVCGAQLVVSMLPMLRPAALCCQCSCSAVEACHALQLATSCLSLSMNPQIPSCSPQTDADSSTSEMVATHKGGSSFALNLPH